MRVMVVTTTPKRYWLIVMVPVAVLPDLEVEVEGFFQAVLLML